jgi:hypothetical protein
MKNAAWYHKLWRKKLDQLPIQDNADAGWAEMDKLLNQHMPVSGQGHGNSHSAPKPFGAKIISLLGYVVPVAAMVGAAAYLVVHQPVQRKVSKAKVIHTRQLKQDSLSGSQLKDLIQVKDSLLLVKAIPDSTHQRYADTTALSHQLYSNTQASPTVKTPVVVRNKPAINDNSEIGTAKHKLKGTATALWMSRHAAEIATNTLLAENRLKVSSPLPEAFRLVTGVVRNHQQGSTKGAVSSKATEGQSGLPASEGMNANRWNDNKLKTDDVPKEVAAGADLLQKQQLNEAERNAVLKAGIVNPEQGNKVEPSGTARVRLPHVQLSKGGRFKDTKQVNHEPPVFNYGLEAGSHTASFAKSFYAGAWGRYSLDQHWLLQAGVRWAIAQPVSGQSKYNYGVKDSTAFTVLDSRRITTLSIPLQLGYRLFDKVTLYAGPQVSSIIGQSSINSHLGTVMNRLDTLGHSRGIDSAFRFTSINKFNIGMSLGLSVHLGQFYLDGRWLRNLTPYKVSIGLGMYRQTYQTLQFGIRYQFKKE